MRRPEVPVSEPNGSSDLTRVTGGGTAKGEIGFKVISLPRLASIVTRPGAVTTGSCPAIAILGGADDDRTLYSQTHTSAR